MAIGSRALSKGIQAQTQGDFDEAKELYKEFIRSQPSNSDAYHNLGIIAVTERKYSEALSLLKIAITRLPCRKEHWLTLVAILIEVSQIDEAVEYAREAVTRGNEPQKIIALLRRHGLSIEGHSNNREGSNGVPIKGRSEGDPGTSPPAIIWFSQVVGEYKKKNYRWVIETITESRTFLRRSSMYQNLLGASFNALAKPRLAIYRYRAALSIKSDNPVIYNNLGASFKELGSLDEAIKYYKKAILTDDRYIYAYNNLGVVLTEKREFQKARAALETAISIENDFAQAWNNLGLCHYEISEYEKAKECLRKAIKLRRDYAEAHNNLGLVYKACNQWADAVSGFETAIELDPRYETARLNLAVSFQDMNEIGAAKRAYKDLISRNPEYAIGHYQLSSLKQYKLNDPHLKLMLKLIRQDPRSKGDKIYLAFAIAKAYEDIGDFKRSFNFYLKGNSLRKALLNYSINTDKLLFHNIVKAHSKILVTSACIIKEIDQPQPIFIVGMPRSGTSLIEQVLSSHSLVVGAGELPFIARYGGKIAAEEQSISESAMLDIRTRYLQEIKRIGLNATFVTDKMPQNFRFLGLICKIFPEAKIVYVTRQRAAIVWSNFKHNFTNEGLGYTCNLDDILDYYDLHKELMLRWFAENKDQIYTVNYDNFTENQKDETLKLLSYLTLLPEKSCFSPHKNARAVQTASQSQVRKAVYQGSSQKWRKFEPYILQALQRHSGL